MNVQCVSLFDAPNIHWAARMLLRKITLPFESIAPEPKTWQFVAIALLFAIGMALVWPMIMKAFRLLKRRVHFDTRTVAALAGVLLCTSLLAVSATAGERRAKLPRTEYGHPDLQGYWKSSNSTPWERPNGITTRLLTQEQATDMTKKIESRYTNSAGPEDPDDDHAARSIEPIRGELRSSVIVDPADGKLPVNSVFRAAAQRARSAMFAPADGPEQVGGNVRCIGSLTTPPLMRPLPFVQRFQIVQSRDRIMIHGEAISVPRIVRMNAAHTSAALTSWTGDSIGWWEGSTLVIETTHFGGSDVRGSPEAFFLISPQAVVTERITRTSLDQLQYEFTVQDSVYYTQAWKGESHLRSSDEAMYEYACHEGNYSLGYILQAARALEEKQRH